MGNDRFNARILRQVDLSADTPHCLKDDEWYWYMLALLNSNFTSYMLKLFNPTIHFTKYDLTRIPFMEPSDGQKSYIENNTIKIVDIIREISVLYGRTFEQINGTANIENCIEKHIRNYIDACNNLHELKCNNDALFYEIYGLEKIDIERIEADYRRKVEIDEKHISKFWIVLEYLRNIVKQILKQRRLYTKDMLIKEILTISKNYLVKNLMIIEQIEEILASLAQIISVGAKNNGLTVKMSGDGIKDVSEHNIATLQIGGKGKNKEIIFWSYTEFLTDYIESDCYAMQNEIRCLTNEVYLPKLQRAKEKLQAAGLSVSDKKNLEKEVFLYEEC